MITRDEATRLAEREIVARGLGTGVAEVRSADEMQGYRLNVYNAPPLAECWIAYAARPLRGLFASTVVLIDIHTGAIRYCGSANDEG